MLDVTVVVLIVFVVLVVAPFIRILWDAWMN